MENELKAAILLIMASFAVGAYAYALLPEQAASHWGLSGEVNGYLPKVYGAFLVPALMTVLFAVFIVIPRIDPLRANIQTFKAYYYGFVLVITSFMFIIYVQTILWNLGTMVSFSLTMPVLLGGLSFYTGIVLEKVKKNWFIGIRTPWTLSSDEVWDRTHRLGGKMFKGVGVACMLSALLPAYAFLIVIALLIGASVGLVAYSYVEYGRLMKTGKKAMKRA